MYLCVRTLLNPCFVMSYIVSFASFAIISLRNMEHLLCFNCGCQFFEPLSLGARSVIFAFPGHTS